MDAGQMRDRIELLVLRENAGGFAWERERSLWARARKLSKTNLFSRLGLGRPTVEFTMRRRALTLHSAFRLDGHFCFLTEITPADDRIYMTVQAALVEPVSCTVRRSEVSTDNPLKRPVVLPEREMVFPAVLTERYVSAKAETPRIEVVTGYVLVAPKEINLSSGELVTVGKDRYRVQVGHLLDEYKNEFEVARWEDA